MRSPWAKEAAIRSRRALLSVACLLVGFAFRGENWDWVWPWVEWHGEL